MHAPGGLYLGRPEINYPRWTYLSSRHEGTFDVQAILAQIGLSVMA